MATCAAAHAEFEKKANGKIHVRTLPEWTRVTGKVAYAVYQGPYSGMASEWSRFPQNVMKSKLTPNGPCGDVYLCPMEDHPGGEKKLLTVLYFPVK
jgi:effector-binding domain-containing protein